MHDQAVFLDQLGVPDDIGTIDHALVGEDTRRLANVAPGVILRVRAPAITDRVPVGAISRQRRFRNDARQPEDKQGTEERLGYVFHRSTPR